MPSSPRATTRRLGVPSAGIPFGPGRYWVRVDNDCAAPAGYLGSPPFVPVVVEDNQGAGCSDTSDLNETAVLTAWSEVTDSAGRLIGRARIRAHVTIGNPWKHSCYDQDGGLCIEDAVGGCNNNPCVDPSDPHHPNGPAKGDLPIPSDIRCGTAGSWIISADPGFGHPERCGRVRGHYGHDAVRGLSILSVGAVSARADAGMVSDGHELRLRRQPHRCLFIDPGDLCVESATPPAPPRPRNVMEWSSSALETARRHSRRARISISALLRALTKPAAWEPKTTAAADPATTRARRIAPSWSTSWGR